MLSVVIFGSQHTTLAQMPVELDAIAQVVYPPTEDRGAPSRTTGSGSRGDCGESVASLESSKLTALTPLNNISTTVNPHPTLYFYVPATEQIPAELTIYNLTQKERAPVYQTRFTLPQTSGIVKVAVPKTVELKSDQTYIWNFTIYCDSNFTQAAQYVNGWLERVTLPSQKQAQLQRLQQQPLAIAQLYAEAGIWNETLEILSQIRSTYPQIWKEFLASVGLNHLQEYPLINAAEH
jgi:hypothetical protein